MAHDITAPQAAGIEVGAQSMPGVVVLTLVGQGGWATFEMDPGQATKLSRSLGRCAEAAETAMDAAGAQWDKRRK